MHEVLPSTFIDPPPALMTLYLFPFPHSHQSLYSAPNPMQCHVFMPLIYSQIHNYKCNNLRTLWQLSGQEYCKSPFIPPKLLL